MLESSSDIGNRVLTYAWRSVCCSLREESGGRKMVTFPSSSSSRPEFLTRSPKRSDPSAEASSYTPRLSTTHKIIMSQEECQRFLA